MPARNKLLQQAKQIFKSNRFLTKPKTTWTKRRLKNFVSANRKTLRKIRGRDRRLELYIQRGDVAKMFKEKVPYTKLQANRVLNYVEQQRSTELNLQDRRYYTAGFAGLLRPINKTTERFWFDLLTKGAFQEQIATYGSDELDEYNIREAQDLEIIDYRGEMDEEGNFRRIYQNNVGYFPYLNKEEQYIDLKRYGIYPTSDTQENCVINALNGLGLPENITNTLKLEVAKDNQTFIKRSHLGRVSEIIKMCIVLNYVNVIENENNGRTYQKRKTIYGDKTLPKLELAMYLDHMFILESTKYTSTSIKNYYEVRELEEWWKITKVRKGKTKNTYNREEAKYKPLNSLDLIVLLHKEQIFIKGDMTNNAHTGHSIHTRDHIYLDNIDKEQRLFRPPEQVEKSIKRLDRDKTKVYYADCESFVSTGKHSLYLLGVSSEENDNVKIYNVCDYKTDRHNNSPEQLLIWNFLSYITKNKTTDALVYFHNLKYDLHIIGQYFRFRDMCQKGGQVYSVKITYGGKTIELRDSYKLLNWRLASFTKNLGLDKKFSKAEAIAYKFYTPERNGKMVKKSEYRECLSKKDKLVFDKLMEEQNASSSTSELFNATTYYIDYLKLDCLVLKHGLLKFDEMVKPITKDKLSIFDCLTISSLTDKFFQISGAYEGVYECTGNLRKFISESIYGGRVHVNEKYQKKVVEGKIADYDAVSLYPSAIKRMCDVKHDGKGVPLGKAKRFTSNELQCWKTKFYSVLQVKITKVNKHQQMPFIAERTSDSINYINHPPANDVIIDCKTLEDYIRFHEIEYELLDGVYWDEGGNCKFGELIQNLFNERLKAKANKQNGLQNLYKLMLNSSYGKTIQKPTKECKAIINEFKYTKDKEDKWVKETKSNINQYIIKNFNTINNIIKLNKSQYEISQNSVDKSYNRCHIGSMVLSYSKRVMNEVFGLANDLKIPIYYQDTDSCHLPLEGVKVLEQEYEKMYNRTLSGKKMGQLHVDFDLHGAKGEIYSTHFIGLGKKSYLDNLECINPDGTVVKGYHIRMKGITQTGLIHQAKKYNKQDLRDGYYQMYKELAKGVKMEFTLNPYNPDEEKESVLFEFNKTSKDSFQVSTKSEFKRIVSF